MDNYYLIADIGGTHIRLGIVNKELGNYSFLESYRCVKYPSINEAIKSYLQKIPKDKYPSKGILAIAATLGGDIITMTNHSWNFSIKELQQELNFKDLKIINDFEAQAYSVEYLEAIHIKCLIKAKFDNKEFTNKIIAGPGTGLGTSLLYYHNDKFLVMPSEAGHSNIGACNAKEEFIFNYFQKEKGIYPYAEAFLSGKGIVNIYKALCAKNNVTFNSDFDSKAIFTKALNEETSLYQETIETFCDILGTYIRNIALIYLPHSIYLTGGILPKIVSFLQKEIFRERFLHQGIPTVDSIINKISVNLIIKENPAMFGLCKYICNGNMNY